MVALAPENGLSKQAHPSEPVRPSMATYVINLDRSADGSALSHACLWQIASATDTPTTIAEDDAVFRHDFVAAARDAIAKLPPDWDLVLWGWNFDSILCVELLPGIAPCALLADQLQLRQKIEEFQARPIPAMPIKLLRAFGAVAYSVSAAGAHNLMRLCLPIRPAEILFPVINQVASNNGIDMMMSVAYPRLQAFVSVPPLVVTENRRDISTIQGRD